MQALALSPPPCVLRRLTDDALRVIKVTATVRTSPPPVALNMTDAQTGMKLRRSGDWFQRAQSNQHIKREVLKRLQKVGIHTHTQNAYVLQIICKCTVNYRGPHTG